MRLMAGSPARRLLFVVSRERVDLYESLRTALWNEMDCEIILDRREGERRRGERRAAARGGRDRRGAQRRQRTLVDREIRACGWVVVNISTWSDESVDEIRRGLTDPSGLSARR
jgi:hypothetical protein